TPSILRTGSTAAVMIADGENGFLKSRTPADYARLISAIAADREALGRAGKGARATLCRSWQNVVGEVINRYDEIIDRYGRK
ncbi:MAG: glycosyltransferase family 4 protein, partial [Duncaniella sp.]|nr:glycosyltransferase family 4 protein [Duncaniella sp.]